MSPMNIAEVQYANFREIKCFCIVLRLITVCTKDLRDKLCYRSEWLTCTVHNVSAFAFQNACE